MVRRQLSQINIPNSVLCLVSDFEGGRDDDVARVFAGKGRDDFHVGAFTEDLVVQHAHLIVVVGCRGLNSGQHGYHKR